MLRLDMRLYRPDVRSVEDPNERLVRLPENLLFVDREQLPFPHHHRTVDDDGADCASMRREGQMGIELVAIAWDERCEANVIELDHDDVGFLPFGEHAGLVPQRV